MPELPSGTVTFLFTDIAGSTALWERDRAAMREAVARQLAILQSLISAHHGVLSKTVGDGTQAAFASAEEALRAAVASQRALLAEAWGELGPLRVRMALHAGEAAPDDQGDYLAAPLNRLSRLLSTGYGGQILLSQAVQQLTRGALPAGSDLRDLGEHRLRDLLEPERVFQLLHPELPDQFPPLQSLEARRTNLPRQPTPFLGREHEVGAIAVLLRQPEVQLLTLTGAGGTGKTRLALQAAAELLDDFADGVFFVPLAALADTAQVLPAIATAVGVREDGEQPLLERLAAFLAHKQLLLVIDNWEHLLAGAAALGEVLQVAPGLTVLATSRAPLHLQAEREYPVPPLALPRRKPPPTLEQLSQYEAVRLFIARAQAVKPDFSVDNANAPAVAEICHRLDGLPLAIELAAAHLRLLPPQALLNRLEQRLPLLTGGARDAPARQQTLRQTIAWSHDLLSPEEQTLFHRLAVFTEGFSFEAAEAVANPEGEADVFAGLERLSEHSLLRTEEGVVGEPRFTMLETVGEFGREQLAASGDEDATRDRHVTFYVEEARRIKAYADMRRMQAWFAGEQSNVRAALTRLESRSDAERLLSLTCDTYGAWMEFGYAEEARRWLESGLATGEAIGPRLRAKALSCLAGMLFELSGRTADALARGKEALALTRSEGDWELVTDAAQWCGLSSVRLGQPEQAEAYFHEARAARLQMPSGPPLERELAQLDNLLAFAAMAQGDLDRAEELFASARDRERAREDELGIFPLLAFPLIWLGHVARCRGDAGAALIHYQEGLAVAAQFGDVRAITVGLAGAAGVLAALGHWQDAATLFGATQALCDRAGISFAAHAYEWQRAAGLPEPWQRGEEPFTWLGRLRAALAGVDRSPLPALADPETANVLWTAGRNMTSDEAVAMALDSDLTRPASVPDPRGTMGGQGTRVQGREHTHRRSSPGARTGR